VRAIGLSGQMHGAVLLDAGERVLRPAILWDDGRAAAECAELEAGVDVRGLTGNAAMPGFTAPKLLWLRKHEPRVRDAVRRVLLPKDWLRLRLTGDAVSDCSDASGTLWLDVAARRWSAPMLAACGLDEGHMPRLVEGSAPSGALRDDVARAWGLRPGILVAGGGGDNAASAVGVGAVRAGEGFVSLGTSGVVFAVGDRFRSAPERGVHAFAHALPGRWHQMSVMLSAAGALSWATRLLRVGSEAELVQAAAGLSPAQRARAPIFLPYLSGERTPHNDPHATGVFVGLRHEHDAAAIGHAVLEGVAFGLRDGLDAMRGVDADESPLAVVGGGGRSDDWAAMLATVLGRVLLRGDDAGSAAALGAARLGWLAAGGNEDDACRKAEDARRFEPDRAHADMVAGRLERFRALYSALQRHF
jgi:xylulokinase